MSFVMTLSTVLGRLILIAAICTPTIAFAIEPTVALSIEQPGKPIIHGTTNLPDGAELMLTITKNGGGYTAQDIVKVTAGRFATQTFSEDGHPVPRGRYAIEVSMSVAALQTPEVQTVIGTHGEKMTGRFIGGLGEPVFDYVEQRELGGVS